MNPIVCLFPVIVMATGGHKYWLLRRVQPRKRELPRGWAHPDPLPPWQAEPYANLLQPALCGEMKVGDDATLLHCLYRLAEEQGSWGFAQVLREKESALRELPPIDGMHAFVVGLDVMEAHTYAPQFCAHAEHRQALWMTPDEVLAIEPVGLIEAHDGLPNDSKRMLPDYRDALREVIAWQMGQN